MTEEYEFRIDLNKIPFSNLVNKPTTLAGYGITDGGGGGSGEIDGGFAGSTYEQMQVIDGGYA